MKFLTSISIFLILIAFSPLHGQQGQASSGSDITLSPEAEAAIASGDEEALAEAIEKLIAAAVAEIAPEDIDAIEAAVSGVIEAVAAAVVLKAVESGASAEDTNDLVQMAAEATFRAAAEAGVSAPTMVAVVEQFTAGAEAAAAEANIAVQVDVAEVFAEAEEPVIQTSLVAISIPAPEITPEDAGIILVSPEDQEPGEPQEEEQE